MKVLVVYHLWSKNDRGTINEHLYSFEKYSNEKCYYLNTAYGVPDYIARIGFDLVIFHYSFCYFVRRAESGWYTPRIHKLFKELECYKVAVPQDEYVCSDRLSEFFSYSGVKTVFTALPESEWQKVYPREKSGLEHYSTVFTGYVDEVALRKLARSNQEHKSRPIDIGYRARKNPYWLGKFGMIKWQVTEKFLNAPVRHNLKLDLSNDPRDVLYGNRWYMFLGNCRVTLGCESGASLHDPDGSIMTKVDQYVSEHPTASFEEVEEACFPGLDGNLRLFTLSPRHFEACMTRTCQALVEGEYGGVFKPGVHYIEIKKDWSNIPDVIKQIEDVDFCERIAGNAYRDIVESGLYTYRNFVQLTLNHVRSVHQCTSGNSSDDSRYLRLLELRERFPLIFSPVTFAIVHVKYILYRLLVKLNLYSGFKRLESRVRNV